MYVFAETTAKGNNISNPINHLLIIDTVYLNCIQITKAFSLLFSLAGGACYHTCFTQHLFKRLGVHDGVDHKGSSEWI